MGKTQSKPFTQWDLDRFINVTGVPRETVEKLYQEFAAASGKNNKLDKKEFRRLYKEMMLGSGTGMGSTHTALVAGTTEHDQDKYIEKVADRVFKAFDTDNTGSLTFEEFVNCYCMLNQRAAPRDRLKYVLDQNNPTPGYITKDHGEQVYNRMNKFYNYEDKTTSVTTAVSGQKPVTWQQHWERLDDGSGRVPQEKFVEWTTSNFEPHFNKAIV